MAFNLLEDVNLEPGVAIFLVILFVVLSIVAVIFLIFGIRRDRNRLRAEKYKIKELDKAGFIELIKQKYQSANDETFFTVMLIQIEGVAGIRSSLGDRQYRSILATIKERLVRVMPHGSKHCDYDDDRIGVFIEEEMDTVGISNLATMMLSEINRPISVITRAKIKVNANLGAASNNEFSSDADLMIQNLEISLATAEKSGLNKFAVYSQEIAERQTDEYRRYQEIKTAISEKQFTLFYQPIYDVNANKIVAFESFVRWKHPTLGILSPDRFLPVMEQTGDINWIGGWGFEEMLRAQTNYYRLNADKTGVIFSFNLSPKQLMYPRLSEEFHRIFKCFKLPPQNICLEIVEFAIFDKVPEVAENIRKLAQMGFKIAIDDFGLEMSSLKMLEDMNFDWVKLDKKFIEQAQDDFLIGGVVETLVGFAKHKNFTIVAEGVEDEIVLNYIKGLKIPYGQGYHYGKPQPPEEYKI